MNIVTQNFINYLMEKAFSNYWNILAKIAYPLSNNPTVFNYGNLLEELQNSATIFILEILRSSFEAMDLAYRNRPGRTNDYYVKNTRERTIITLFGPVTYMRTIYINRHDGSYYCHVDEQLGLTPYDTYAPCVKARAAALYANHNSMIKVGKILGEEIFCLFSLSKRGEDYAIPRQTIQNMIKDMGLVRTGFKKKKVTPKTIYIMADEKWIPLQEFGMKDKKMKVMCKEVVIFEGIENAYKTSNLEHFQRHRLIGKTRIMAPESQIWESVEEALYQLYDVEKIECIELMGDGANWIKAGVNELTNSSYEIKYSLDEFHLNQALLRAAPDKEDREELHKLIYEENDKKGFIEACKSLTNKEGANVEKIEKNMNYILNNWRSIIRRIKEVSVPCAMEGSICHDICNSFTSVPKAYNRKNIPIYIKNREHYLNGVHMTHLFFSAMDKKKEDDNTVDLSDTYIYDSSPVSNDYKQPAFIREIAHPKHAGFKYI